MPLFCKVLLVLKPMRLRPVDRSIVWVACLDVWNGTVVKYSTEKNDRMGISRRCSLTRMGD